MNLVAAALNRSLFINLMTIVIIVFGVMSVLDMRREAFPAVDFDVVSIVAVYPGASPRSMEKYVAVPIEREIDKVDGVKKFETRNIEGLTIIVVTLSPDLENKDKVVTDLQRALDNVTDLPEDMTKKVALKELNSDMMTVVDVVLSGNMPYKMLRQHAKNLIDRLEENSGVSSVYKWGYRDKEFWVVVDPAKINSYGLSFVDISRSLKSANVTVPGGTIEGPSGEILVRTVGEVTNSREIGEIVIRSNDAGVVIRIKDIARVQETFAERTQFHKSYGSEAIVLKVKKSRLGDIVDLVDSVRDLTIQYQEEAKDPELKLKLVNDLSTFVRNRLSILGTNGITGTILVLIILLLFLSPGIAGVAAVGLPVAFLGALILMNFQGHTINLLSMFALVIVLGMVVDDAIIVAENIWSHYEQGKSPRQAAIDGTLEVFWPVTATIMTTLAAFSPLMMVSGIFGRFIEVLPMVVIACLLVSLMEAILILPVHAFDVLSWREARAKRLGRASHQRKHPILDFTRGLYRRSLAVTLRWRWPFCLCLFGFLLFTLWHGKKMPLILFPSEGIEQFFVRIDFPESYSLKQSTKGIQPFEDEIKGLPKGERKAYVVNVGVQQVDEADPFTQRGSHIAQIAVSLTPENTRQRTADEIIKSLRPKMNQLAERYNLPRVYFVRKKQGPPVGKPVAIRITGDSLETIQLIAKKVMAHLDTVSGVADIAVNLRTGKKEAVVKVDHAKASQSLLSVASIAQHIRTAWAGEVASYVRSQEERIPIRVVFPKSMRESPKALGNLDIPNARNSLIPLKSVAEIRYQDGLQAIFHHDGNRTATVTAALDEAVTSSEKIHLELSPLLASLRTEHQAYTITAGGEWEDTTESIDSLKKAFFMALFLIYIILASLFRSILQPIVVMTAIPFSIIGVIWALSAHDLPLSFFAMVGAIGLAGVVVNDSIVLVDFMNKAIQKGQTAFDAALEAGQRRYRAVWLTTLTTVFGLLPVVYGIGGMDKFLRPAALTLSYGLVFGTILVLYFVPALCLIHRDLTSIGKKVADDTVLDGDNLL